jgi:hypothetical protein
MVTNYTPVYYTVDVAGDFYNIIHKSGAEARKATPAPKCLFTKCISNEVCEEYDDHVAIE